MLLSISGFQGTIPRLHPRLLPDSFAQEAHNARLDDGALSPIRAPADTFSLPGQRRTFLRHQGVWRSWTGEVDAAPGPVADDRLYWTGDGAPKVEAGGVTYDLALPPPSSAPSLSVPAGETQPGGETPVEEVIYVYTFVTELDEESAPSLPSDPVYYADGDVIRVSGFEAPPAGRGVDRIRLYRSQTSLSGDTSFYYVAEFYTTTIQYDHDLAAEPMQELLPTFDYDMPPATLSGLTPMPNGMMAAFTQRELRFCEPYRPHAWPRKYELTTEHPIVALAALGSTLIVLTTGRPYIAQGTHPENMVMEQLEQDLPCVSARGVVDLGYAAVFPSADGLARITPQGGQIVSRPLFSRDDWRALAPSTFEATSYNGRYLYACRPEAGQPRKVGFIDLSGERPFHATADGRACAFWRDLTTGEVFFLEGDYTGDLIRQWDAGAAQTMRWRSKRAVLPTVTNFGVFMADTEGGASFTARVYADGALIHSETTPNAPVRLPGGFLADTWEIEVETDMTVSALYLAGAVPDLFGG